MSMESSFKSYKHPSPSLSIINEPSEDWREVATADKRKTIDRYVSPSFVREVLTESDFVVERVFR